MLPWSQPCLPGVLVKWCGLSIINKALASKALKQDKKSCSGICGGYACGVDGVGVGPQTLFLGSCVGRVEARSNEIALVRLGSLAHPAVPGRRLPETFHDGHCTLTTQERSSLTTIISREILINPFVFVPRESLCSVRPFHPYRPPHVTFRHKQAVTPDVLQSNSV